ncbi:MAG: YgjV family protein [Eubacteriales bacterium]|jgi:hypothetical protein
MNSETLALIAKIIGYIAVSLALFVYISKSRKVILATKLSNDVLWATHYILIGGWSGAALNIMAIGRETVFYFKEKKWASSRVWLYVFLALTWLSCFLTWEGPQSLLPMAGTSFAVVSFWCSDPLKVRLLAIPAQILWLIYGILHMTVPGIIGSSISLISILIGLAGDYLRYRRKENEEAGEIEPAEK